MFFSQIFSGASVLVLGAALAVERANAASIPRQDSQPISTLVDLGYAQYQGVANGAGVNQYLGMRYAAPVLGDNRFRAPQDPVQQDGVQDASAVCQNPKNEMRYRRYGEEFVTDILTFNSYHYSSLPSASV